MILRQDKCRIRKLPHCDNACNKLYNKNAELCSALTATDYS